MKINVWECEACGKRFHPEDVGYGDKTSLEINLEGIFPYDENIDIAYNEICYKCYKTISNSILNMLNKIKE